MPYYPKPQYPADIRNGRTRVTLTTRDYTLGGGGGEPRVEQFDTLDGSAYKSHIRNKLVHLGNGVMWKPCANFTCGYLKMEYPSGTVVTYDSPRVPERPFISSKSGQAPLFQQPPVGPFQSWVGGWDFLVPNSMPSDIESRLAVEVMQKVGDRKASYGESLGEARQTVNHLASSVSQLARAYLAARKGRWGDVAKVLGVTRQKFKSGDTPSKRWLEYQYGWLPLMGDIYDTYDLLQDGFRKEAFIMSSVRVLRDRHSYDKTPPKNNFDRVAGYSDVSYRCKVYYRVNESDLAKFNQLGMINPAEVAWALVPFSFVADWFVPVSDIMEALAARFGVTFIDGFYGTRVTGRYRTYLNHFDPGDDESSSANTLYNVAASQSYNRRKIYGFPVPGFYWKKPFSSTKLISALALVRQLIR